MDRIWIPTYLASALFVTYIITNLAIIFVPQRIAVNSHDTQYLVIPRQIYYQENRIQKVLNSSSTNLATKEVTSTTEYSSPQNPDVKNWPRVFVLSDHPLYPVICYSGKSININKPINTTTSTQEDENETNHLNTKTTKKKFILSDDPQYPVVCQEGHIPGNLTDDGTVEDEGISYETANVTCIRRDYEKNISAIFLNKPGPIQKAWNIFDNTIAYGYFTVENLENIGHIKVLNETIVDCDDYDFDIGDKEISDDAAKSLASQG